MPTIYVFMHMYVFVCMRLQVCCLSMHACVLVGLKYRTECGEKCEKENVRREREAFCVFPTFSTIMLDYGLVRVFLA